MNCSNCGAAINTDYRFCRSCGTQLQVCKTVVDELQMLQEMQLTAQAMEPWPAMDFWRGAPLTTFPEAMVKDVLQALSRIKPGSWWNTSMNQGLFNDIFRMRVKGLLGALEIAAISDAELGRKVTLLKEQAKDKL